LESDVLALRAFFFFGFFWLSSESSVVPVPALPELQYCAHLQQMFDVCQFKHCAG